MFFIIVSETVCSCAAGLNWTNSVPAEIVCETGVI